jgi:DNA replicative helicase MCM subunit Mcm2 (Cdc46/Mcm family)
VFATASAAYAPGGARPANATATPATVPAAKATSAVPKDNPHQELILALAEKLDDGKGAPWEDIVAEASKKGVKEAEVEECLNDLMDKGQIYEPVLGRLKRT